MTDVRGGVRLQARDGFGVLFAGDLRSAWPLMVAIFTAPKARQPSGSFVGLSRRDGLPPIVRGCLLTFPAAIGCAWAKAVVDGKGLPAQGGSEHAGAGRLRFRCAMGVKCGR